MILINHMLLEKTNKICSIFEDRVQCLDGKKIQKHKDHDIMMSLLPMVMPDESSIMKKPPTDDIRDLTRSEEFNQLLELEKIKDSSELYLIESS